jgi:hypothetical protein
LESQDSRQDELSGAGQVAERAGAIVSDHVRSIIDSAQARADEVTSEAESEARALRAQAHGTASTVLERIDTFESTLGDRVNGLREEAAAVSESGKERS